MFAIYSSITGQNLLPIMDAMLKPVKLDSKKGKLQALGQEFCTKMIDHPQYAKITETDWNTYRDLDKVFTLFKDFSRQSTLVIDAESLKVQLCRENAIVVTNYKGCDVMGKPFQDGLVRGPKWQT